MLLAYGQTGSGKTYSVTGLERLLVEKLMRDAEKEVHICVFEVAGNNLYGPSTPLPFSSPQL
jgi:kinesin family protein 2/24